MSTDAGPDPETDPFDPPRLCRYFSEGSPQPVLAAGGAAHTVRYVNPAFLRLSGLSAAQLLGRPFAAALPEVAWNGCLELFDRVYRTGTAESLPEREHTKNPATHWSYAIWPILGAAGRPVGIVIQVTDATEIVAYRSRAQGMNEALLLSTVRQHELIETIERGERERRALEAQMFRVQKLESLGVLAGGIAHDLNNMLTPIVGYAELVATTLPPESTATPLLDEITKNAYRAAELVQKVLAYAGKGQFYIRPHDLNDVTRRADPLLKAVLRGDVRLEYDLVPAPLPVDGDGDRLCQVLVGLVTNAVEAVGVGAGTVTVRTGSLPAAPTETGATVYVEVADTGCGMTPDVIEKLFDPFFTTKFPGRGLGLAVAHGIARVHRGGIQVTSEPGHGSTVRLVLPAATDPGQKDPAAG